MQKFFYMNCFSNFLSWNISKSINDFRFWTKCGSGGKSSSEYRNCSRQGNFEIFSFLTIKYYFLLYGIFRQHDKSTVHLITLIYKCIPKSSTACRFHNDSVHTTSAFITHTSFLKLHNFNSYVIKRDKMHFLENCSSLYSFCMAFKTSFNHDFLLNRSTMNICLIK